MMVVTKHQLPMKQFAMPIPSTDCKSNTFKLSGKSIFGANS